MTIDAPITPFEGTPAAAVWLDAHHATVARRDIDGRVTTVEVERGVRPEAAYLGRVVSLIGDRQRILILGPSSPRLALEREYVAVFKRPDRLFDTEDADQTDAVALIERLSSPVLA
jgi:hypothetical protein